MGPFPPPFRVEIRGKTVPPPLFESMCVIGRQETVQRVENALAALKAA